MLSVDPKSATDGTEGQALDIFEAAGGTGEVLDVLNTFLVTLRLFGDLLGGKVLLDAH